METYYDGTNVLQRSEMRLRQDFLLMLTDMNNLPRHFTLAENCPVTLTQLAQFVYPEWQGLVSQKVLEFAEASKVGVPDFKLLAGSYGTPVLVANEPKVPSRKRKGKA